MVCGRLPFGDDSQVKKQQKNGFTFPSTRSVSRNARKLIYGILNPSIEERFDTYDIILHEWTASQPVKAPQPLTTKPKYNLENSLSLLYQSSIGPKPHPLMQAMQANPLLAKVGSYKKRAADTTQQQSQAPAPPPSVQGSSINTASCS